jgi:putative DNA primase/helicase
LPFDFDENAECPKFMAYLNRVLPDENMQHILSEFLGYVFINTETLKLEKTLMLVWLRCQW